MRGSEDRQKKDDGQRQTLTGLDKQQASGSQTIGDRQVLEGGMKGPMTALARLCPSIMGTPRRLRGR